jgi:hypothetical protein
MQSTDLVQDMQKTKEPTRRSAVKALSLILMLLVILVPATSGHAAPLSQDSVWTITSPPEGSTVSGEVVIQGTATHPNFGSYEVLYAPGPGPTGESVWQRITLEESMVVNGPLATWDTTGLQNGKYTLALAVWEPGGGGPHLHFSNNITVLNEEATPTPEPTATPELEPSAPDPTQDMEAPPPAATIELPATVTPQPTPTLAPEGAAGGEEGGDDDGGLFNPAEILSMDAIKEAFTMGAQLAFLLYAVGILYVLAKAVIRYYLRQTQGESNP